MDLTTEDFFHEFRHGLMAGAEANSAFQIAEFMETISKELIETGFIEGFEFCHYRAQRGMRVDGFYFDDEGCLDLFIADYENRAGLFTLTGSELVAAFKRLANFFEASLERQLFRELEETSPGYGLARQISDRKALIYKVNFFLLSERCLSDRLQTIEETKIAGLPVTYHVWDISRLHRQTSSRGHKESLDINLKDMFGKGLPCLQTSQGSGTYQSFLIVIPGEVLATIYEKYGARLLEQNVRSFLQSRGNVNKGIRTTILNDPSMFFAYNNGVTATAQEVETGHSEAGFEITRIRDLQIVNGGQTTASLFHTRRRDKASLKDVFVQMKLCVVDSEQSVIVVPKISEYANTQNRVNAADFFSNHPFHIRIEEFSRRIWAPAQIGSQRETKWFYERARGQYADEQFKRNTGDERRFKLEHPKTQMFTKTELAKFENIWDDHPRWVNLGSQKNFAKYSTRIGQEWDKSSEVFNEFYFRRVIARAILFRRTERLVSEQSWYNGGYRANIVAYAIAAIGECSKRRGQAPDWQRIWNAQSIYPSLENSLMVAARFVNEDILSPPSGVSNISEWCKKEACWSRILQILPDLERRLPREFFSELESLELQADENRQSKKAQRTDDGIKSQIGVIEIPAKTWKVILEEGVKRKLLTNKEIDILRIAEQIPSKIPTPKQCVILLETFRKLNEEGVTLL